MVTKSVPDSGPARNLSANYDWKQVEPRVRRFYSEAGIRKQIERRFQGQKAYGWVEGPPTLNNQPHIGHVRGRIIKDLYYRWSTLEGVYVVFRGGWDTQGLPVELQAEKELGLTGNKWENLKQVGEEKLVQACKDMIAKYRRAWEEADDLTGLLMDQESSYMTYRDSYIEREWKYLEVAWKAGILNEGFKVVPYCPSCQTSLSQAELALGGYEMLDDPSLYYKVKASDGSYLVIWTTMPFTVVTDELVAVKPDAQYEYVEVGGESWVVGSERKAALSKEIGVKFGKSVKKVRGSELEGLTYVHPLLSEIPGLRSQGFAGKVHRVVAEEFVDTSTGTGLVHLSPANGEDDFAVAQRRKVPVFAPFDGRARFTAEAGAFSGLFARDSDKEVSKNLEKEGALVFEGRVDHEYPVCWRSGHRLLWLARREYFYWVDKMRDEMVAAAEKVEYYFEAPKNRFMEFLRESPPWCITRERVWGTPLPVWVCSKCGEKTGVFSRKEILARAESLPDGPDFELHRPWIDRVKLKCPKCGGSSERELFVLDTWHNSGSAPYASFTDEEFKELVPVRFLTEGIDQTRGWANTLLVLNVIMKRKPEPPYRAFLFQGHVLDEKGRKMSKSLGNTIWGLDLLRSRSVDLTRFYLMWKASPEDSLSVDLKEMNSRPYQVLNTLYHLHVYLLQNSSLDGYDPGVHTVPWAEKKGLLGLIDHWLLSKLAGAEGAVEQDYDGARYNEACKAIEDLTINDLSQSYVRLVRSELWRDDEESRERRLAVYAVLGTALRTLDYLLQPVSPFVTEFAYQETFCSESKWTVPMLVRGVAKSGAAISRESEQVVEFALVVEEACNSARTKAKLKRRWPLRSVKVLVQPSQKETARKAAETTANLCNVKEVEIITDPAKFPAAFSLTPNRAKVGALFKKETAEVLAQLKPKSGRKALEDYLGSKGSMVRLGGVETSVPLTAFVFETKPAAGYECSEKGGAFVALGKKRDEELVAEGLVRDVARRLQALRKERGFSPTEVLPTAKVAGLEGEEVAMLKDRKKDLAFLVRVREVDVLEEKEGTGWAEDDLDGRPIYLFVG